MKPFQNCAIGRCFSPERCLQTTLCSANEVIVAAAEFLSNAMIQRKELQWSSFSRDRKHEVRDRKHEVQREVLDVEVALLQIASTA